MAQTLKHTLIFLIIAASLLGAVGCQKEPSPTALSTATLTQTNTITPTPTITQTPTPTETKTPAFTITPLPSNPPTATRTPYRALSPTPSPTEIPLQPAELFPFKDVGGRTVDWSYIRVTKIGTNRLDEVNNLWAFMSFQLLDRGIHQRNLEFLGKTITVYYLHVAHEFDGEMVPMQLVLGGTPGANVAIKDIPAGGTAYLQVQVRESWQPFDPFTIHRDANRDYALRSSDFPLLFLKDFQSLLPTLPDQLIVLADHPILFPPDDWQQVKLDFSRVSYLAARYQPFFKLDDYDRLIDQSDFAYALRDHILEGALMPAGLYAFSSQTLILITDDE